MPGIGGGIEVDACVCMMIPLAEGPGGVGLPAGSRGQISSSFKKNTIGGTPNNSVLNSKQHQNSLPTDKQKG